MTLHENSKGVEIVRIDYVKRSKVVVRNKDTGFIHRTYRFNNTPEFKSQYLSWANLDCCGGWTYSESYLNIAVQEGKKLFAGRCEHARSRYLQLMPTMDELSEKFNAFCEALPTGVVAGIDRNVQIDNMFNTYVCRTGSISDYYDLSAIRKHYEDLGIILSGNTWIDVLVLSTIELRDFGTEKAPFSYINPTTDAELIITGLLLGYPIESTASILSGY